MRTFAAVLFSLATLLPSTFAEIVITLPIGTTVCNGGQPCQIEWEAGQNPPTLQQCGACSFGLYAGNAQQQTLLQPIQPAVPVATTSNLAFTVSPTIGPNFAGYFIRVQCPIQDPTNPLLPELAFSHMFSLAGMSGQFNSTVLQQISASSTGTATGTDTGTGSSTPTQSQTGTASKTASSTTTPKASTTPTTKPNSAASVRVSAGALLALVASAFVLL